MYNKSLIFRSAYAIFKMQNVTFSEALALAWASIKQGIKAIVMKCNRLVKSKGLGYETVYFNELVFVNIVTPRTSQPYNASIEKWYDGKTFNND
jgi:hypothetical protein